MPLYIYQAAYAPESLAADRDDELAPGVSGYEVADGVAFMTVPLSIETTVQDRHHEQEGGPRGLAPSYARSQN